MASVIQRLIDLDSISIDTSPPLFCLRTRTLSAALSLSLSLRRGLSVRSSERGDLAWIILLENDEYAGQDEFFLCDVNVMRVAHASCRSRANR